MVDVGNKTRILGSVEGCGYEKGMGLMGVERLLNYVYINFIQFLYSFGGTCKNHQESLCIN
jgi:hypothetical protein